MPNLKPLIDAVAFVRANPDKHDQNYDGFLNDKRCIASYAASFSGQTKQFDADALADYMGISRDEIYRLVNFYPETENKAAIEFAEAIIAKYAPTSKYAVGMVLESRSVGTRYTITEVSGNGHISFKSNDSEQTHIYTAVQMEDWNPLIVKGATPALVDVEYVTSANGYVLDIRTDKDSAIEFARGVRAMAVYLDYNNEVTLVERPVKPAVVPVAF